MIRIIIGIIIFIIGFVSWLDAENSPESGVIWTSGMSAGAILVFTGARSMLARRWM